MIFNKFHSLEDEIHQIEKANKAARNIGKPSIGLVHVVFAAAVFIAICVMPHLMWHFM